MIFIIVGRLNQHCNVQSDWIEINKALAVARVVNGRVRHKNMTQKQTFILLQRIEIIQMSFA